MEWPECKGYYDGEVVYDDAAVQANEEPTMPPSWAYLGVDPPKYLTVAEAKAKYWDGRQSLRWWYRAAKSGLVPCVRAGGTVRFLAADLDRLEAVGTFPTEPPASAAPPALPPPKPKRPTPQVKGGYRFFPPSS